MVGSVAEWLRHPTGNLETQVQFLAEPHFHLIAYIYIYIYILAVECSMRSQSVVYLKIELINNT